MYDALRTPACRLIANHFRLVSIQQVTIRIKTIVKNNHKLIWKCTIQVDGRNLSSKKAKEFYVKDGFNNETDFILYWADSKLNVVYDLDLYHWTDLRF